MSEPSHFRDAVAQFGEAMVAKLEAHADRPGWYGEDPDWLFTRLLEEVAELRRAIDRVEVGEWTSTDEYAAALDAVTSEAADVANFAMMLAENEGRITVPRA